MSCRPSVRIVLLIPLLLVALPAKAHNERPPEEIVVYGRADVQLGTASAASDGKVGFDDLKIMPIQRVGELVEVIPGMTATQHSGTGKANQYFLRGFNLDHGTDFSASVEGIPVNMSTHGHGQGYLDLNFLIPEMVETASFKKGPYHTSVGDFSSAASVDFQLYERLDRKRLSVSLGENDFQHLLTAGSFAFDRAGDPILTAAAEITRSDGPWRLDENLRQEKLLMAYHWGTGPARYKLMLQHYDNTWRSTDQVPERAVDGGLIDRLGFIDPDLGGDTRRTALSLQIDQADWHLNLYALNYDFRLFSNFSYFLEDPVNGDEFEQVDQRLVLGGHLNGFAQVDNLDWLSELRWGGTVRYDDISDLGLYQTRSRTRFATRRDDEVQLLALDAYAEGDIPLSERLRLIAGVRADAIHWDVRAQRRANSGSDSDLLISPKLSLAYLATDNLELYANWGQGFHSNDVRGTTIRVDPVGGEPVQAVDVFAESEGFEVGLRYEVGRAFNLNLAAFWLDLDSELVFVGDAGGTEASGATERSGYELSAFWEVIPGFAINADYTWTDAEFRGAGADSEIPGAVQETASVGINIVQGNVSIGLSGRYLGEAPLIEDNSVRSNDSVLVHAQLAQKFTAWEWRVEVFNLTDSDDSDIAYFYPSRLQGEPAEGVQDIHYHPLEPRTVRGTLTYFW